MATSTQGSVSQGQAVAPSSAQQGIQQLVVIVEGTSALGPSWSVLRSEYVDKITRAFCGQDGNPQTGGTLEMALVVFCCHGPYNCFLVQRSGWTSNFELFQQWLSSIDFSGGGFGDGAVAEGLAEALVMCCPTTQPSATQPVQRHCVLVAASNPHRLQTPVPHPCLSLGGESQPDHWWLADAETVAKAFPQCHVSLSVVCPRQLPSLKELFAVAKKKTDPSSEVFKHSQHLVLVSDSFLEARSSLRRSIVNAVTSAPSTVAPAAPLPLNPTVKVEQKPVVSAAPATGSFNLPASTVMTSGISAAPTVILPARNMSNGTMTTPTMPTPIVKIEQGLSHSYSSSSMLNSTMVSAVPLQTSATAAAVSSVTQDVPRPSVMTETTSSQDFKPLPANPMQPHHRPMGAASVLNAFSQIRQHTGALGLGAGSTAMPSILSGSVPLVAGQGGLGITQQPVSAGASHAFGGEATSMGALQGTASAIANNTLLPSNVGAMTQSGGIPSNLPPTGPGTVGLGQAMQVSNALGGVQNNLGGQVMQASNGLGVQGTQAGLGMPNNSLATPGNIVPNTNPSAMMQGPHIGTGGVATPPQPSGSSTKYTRLWVGTLAGQRQGKPVAICTLEAYRLISSPETLAQDWPPTMQIIRLIPQDYMNSREYQGKVEYLVFRPVTQHNFLSQLADKKLCAVIQLPTQTLLLASADKRMIGMLFPENMVVFRPQQQNSQPQQPQQQQQQQGPTQFTSFPQGGQLPGQSMAGSGFLP